MLLDVIWIIAGLALLVWGAELLVRGASWLAAAFRVPPLIIGLTIVSFGTGAPELVVGVSAALEDSPSIAVGNVVGSNVINVLAVLGLSAIVAPLAVGSRLVRLDVPIMIGVSVALLLMALNERIGRVEGAILVVSFFAYTAFIITRRRDAPDPESGAPAPPQRTVMALARSLALAGGGGAILAVGANWLVDGATEVAIEIGVSELIVGLTVVAVGTSLPELATSVMAAARGQRDIAVGNVIGSNIFNILAVVGSSALVRSGGLEVDTSAINFDIPVMLAAAIACLPVFFTGGRIDKWEGWLFFGYFLAYILYLVLRASDHDALDAFNLVMVVFAFPLTFATLLVVSVREWMGRREKD